ncbi:MAG: hypothetical protein E6G47_02800 [Actinobacteria bacterium]|nr:MAG: hypothetical protein E6G47_02800 [Actinomycetota bacterium]
MGDGRIELGRRHLRLRDLGLGSSLGLGRGGLELGLGLGFGGGLGGLGRLAPVVPVAVAGLLLCLCVVHEMLAERVDVEPRLCGIGSCDRLIGRRLARRLRRRREGVDLEHRGGLSLRLLLGRGLRLRG